MRNQYNAALGREHLHGSLRYVPIHQGRSTDLPSPMAADQGPASTLKSRDDCPVSSSSVQLSFFMPDLMFTTKIPQHFIIARSRAATAVTYAISHWVCRYFFLLSNESFTGSQ